MTPRDPADRIWKVEPRDIQLGPPDEQGMAPFERRLVAEDVDAALAELTPILLRIGGGVQIVAERTRIDDHTFTTERIVIRWQVYVGKARDQRPKAEANGNDPAPTPAEEPTPEPAAEPTEEPEPAPAEG